MPPVDEKDLISSCTAGGGRQGDKAGQRVRLPMAVHRDQVLCCLSAQNGIDRAYKLPVARSMELLLPVPNDADGYLRVCQRQPLHGGKQRRALHGIPLHKFQTCRRVVEQIPHDDGRSVRAARLAAFRDRAGLQMYAGAEGCIGGFG